MSRKFITATLAAVMLAGTGVFAIPAMVGASGSNGNQAAASQEAPNGDSEEQFHKLFAEFQALQEEVTEVQAQAMEEPEVKEALDTFQASLMDTMKGIDKDIEEKIEHLKEISAQIQTLQFERLSEMNPADPEEGDAEEEGDAAEEEEVNQD